MPTLSFCSSLWPTDIPSDSSFAGVVAKGLSAGTYMVMATLSGAIGTNGDTKEWLTCRLRANSTEIARQTVTPREPGYRFGDPGIAEYHSLSLLGHTTVTGSVNNVFVDCQGGKDVHVRDTHLAAIQVASVG